MLYGALGRTNPCTRRSAGLVALALTAVLGRAHAQSEVSGCEFTHGDGRVERFGNGFLIFAEGGRVIMQCDRFNVGPGNGVEFRQDGATARLLNRINGDFGPSDINGSLTANGIIFIVNPAGVFFGNGTLVNVGGIYAASGNITDSDFLADTYRFDTSAGDMVRVDPGANIAATQMVHLIGRQVANHGDISVGTGTVALIAANDEVVITEMGERISVQVDGVNLDRGLERPGTEDPVLTGEAGVENTGSIEVTSGQVVLGASDMYALAIRNTGDILVGGNDGAAQLTALAGTVLHEGSIRAADVAMTGGVIFLDDDVQADEALFNDAVVLGSDITIEGTDGSATNVEFVSTVDSETDEENGLAVDSADTRFRDDVGGTERLGALDVTGRTLLEGGLVSTTGLQRYGGAVTLGADTTMNAGDTFVTGVRFDDAVDSAIGENYGLVLDAAATFGGAVGSTDALASLDVDGFALIAGGSIETAGSQRYRDAVTLGDDAELTATTVMFESTVDSDDAAARSLTLNADTTFGGIVGGNEALNDLVVDGTAAINTTEITTDGDQTYMGAVTLGADLVTLNADAVEFALTVDSDDAAARSLTLNADTTFGGIVGGNEALNDLVVDGTAAINTTEITTDGDQTYMGAVTLGADLVTLNADAVEFALTVDSDDAAARSLTLNADTTFGGIVGGNEALNDLVVDGTAAINTTEITTDGDQTYMGAVTLGADLVTLNADAVEFALTVDSNDAAARSLTLNADTTFGGIVGGNEALNDLVVDGTAAINTTEITTDGDQTYMGAVTLGADLVTLNADAVEFALTVDSDDAAARSLTLNADTTFGGIVGGNEALNDLVVDGTAAINTTEITTDGDQTYMGAVTLGADLVTLNADAVEFALTVDSDDAAARSLTLNADTTFGGIVGGNEALNDLVVDGTAAINTTEITTDGDQTYMGAVTLGADLVTLNADAVEFALTVDSDDAAARSLTLNADTTFGGIVGGNEALNDLVVDGTAAINTTEITTDGDQTYMGAVTLGADLVTLNAGAVEFVLTVDSAEDENFALDVNAADTRFGGVVGGTDELSELDVSGRARMDGGSVTTTGLQRYRGAVTLGDDTTLTAGDTLATGVRFDGTVDGSQALTLEAATTFGGAVGDDDELSMLDVSGRARIDGGRIRTTGTQVYGGAVVLGTDTRLDAESVEFVMTVDSAAGETHALDVNAADTRFGGVVGGTDKLSELDVSGRARMDGGSVTTTGLQRYRGAVTLGANTTLQGGGEIRFDAIVDGNRHDLTVEAGEDAIFRGDVVRMREATVIAAINARFLGRITDTGAFIVTAGNDATFAGRISETDDFTVTAGDDATFLERIDDTGALTVTAGTVERGGDVMFLESIGKDARVESLAVAAGEAGRIFLGSDDLDLVEVRSSGSQTYASDVTLRSNTSMQGGDDIRFEGSVESTEDDEGNRRDLTIVGDDEVVIGGSADDKLVKVRDLEITGDTFVNAWRVRTTGDQTFHDRVTLGTTDGDQGVEFDGALVTFDDKIVGGGRDLTVDADGALFGGKVVGTGESAVIVVNDVKFLGRIDGTGAFTVEAGNDATFQGRIDDTGAFTVAASNDVTFHKGIGERTKVESLAVTAGESGRITFEAKNHQIVASGDIVLNETNPSTHDGVHKKPGSEATILSTGGGTFTISSKDGGEFRMGRNEKMSVEGSLTIKGRSPLKTAYLSDINTLGDLEVDAERIVILLRESGFAYAPGDEKGLRQDQGVDFVAGGKFIFQVAPTLDDGGQAFSDPQFATTDGQGDDRGTLSGFIMRSFGSSFQSFVVEGVERDLLATGASTTDPAEARAAAPTRETELADVRDQDPFPAGLDRELAQQLAILPRLLSPVEIAARLDGRYLYFDEWPTLVDPNAQDYHEVVIYRLGRQAVEALDTYQALRGRESQIRKRLGEAVFAYREEFGDDAALGEIGATWLAQEDYRDLVEDLQRLNLVLATIAEIGMTSSELERPRRMILENFRPKEIESREELLEVLRTLPETPSGLDEAAPVPGGDAEATG